MIQVENVSKSFGDRVLFDGISFKLNSKERLGLVGRNGHGKTTLFRLIIGEEQPDSGIVVIPKNYRIGYVRQQLEFIKNTILEEGMTALPEPERDYYWKVEKILMGLGFSMQNLRGNPQELSGGYQVRLNLAKALIADPDLLLLDEPTNFLDITSIRWIVNFLKIWPHELMLITHDRGFMDQLVTHTMGIHRRKVRKIAGNTYKYYSQIAREEEIYEKTRIKDERRRKEIEQFITHFRAKARLANLVQSRVKTLQKTQKREKLEKLRILEFSFRSSPFAAKHVLTARKVFFTYSQHRPLVENFTISVGAGERVCVVGPNGMGKSTLMKLLAGELQPQAGEITYHPALKKGFFEQTNIKSLIDSRTVEEEILYSSPDVDRQLARNICGAMMFSGDEALKKISVLSGGEKSRVMLGKVLATPVNLLLLDEPTNHLDMESSDALLAAIDSFDGTVIMVTHNEMFLHALADRLIVFRKEGIEVFEGSYQRFLEKGGWGDDARSQQKLREDGNDHEKITKLKKKDLRRRRSEIISRRSKAIKPLELRMTRTENEIGARENELERLNQAMQLASRNQDGRRIAELSQEIHSCRSAIDRLFEELEKINVDLEAQKALFDRQLEQLQPPTEN
jgi:ATP-binding cassette subfamily F protein 3